MSDRQAAGRAAALTTRRGAMASCGAIMVIFGCAPVTMSAPNSWTSAFSGLWTDPGNWASGVPSASDDVTIYDPSNTIVVTLDSGSRAINSLMLREELAITNGASLSVASSASVGSGGKVRLSGGSLVGGTWNFSGGTFSLDSGGTNTLDGVTIVGQGISTATIGAGVQIQNGLTVSGGGASVQGAWEILDGSTATFTGGGVLFVSDAGTLKGGTWDVSALGQGVRLGGNGGSLDGVTILGNIQNDASAPVSVRNGLTLNGSATIDSDWAFIGTQTISAGTFHLHNDFFGARDPGGMGAPVTLTFASGVIVAGGGRLGEGANTGANDTIINQGSIQDVTAIDAAHFLNQGSVSLGASRTMSIGSQNLTANTSSWDNDGTISMGSGSTLKLGGAFTTSDIGSLQNSSGGTVVVTGALDNTGSTLTLDATTGNWSVEALSPAPAATLTGGSVSIDPGQTLTLGRSVVDGTSISGHTVINSSSTSAVTTMQNGASFSSGTVDVYRELRFDGSTTIMPGATISLLDQDRATVMAYDASNSPVTLTIGSGTTITGGAGAIGSQASGRQDSVVNDGTISADGSLASGILTVGGRTFTNNGLVEVVNGGSARIGTAFPSMYSDTWVNSGTFSVDAGGTLYLGGSFGPSDIGTVTNAGEVYIQGYFDNTGNTFVADATTGTWGMDGPSSGNSSATMTGGSITTADGQVFKLGKARLDGVAVSGDVEVLAGRAVSFVNGSTYAGNADLYGVMTFEYDRTINSGSISLLSPTARIYTSDPVDISAPTTLTIGSGVTIDGFAGDIGLTTTTRKPFTVNHADITVDGSLGSGTMAFKGEGATNTGDIDLINGGNFAFSTKTWSNSGTINVGAGSTLSLGGAVNTASIGTINNSGTVNLSGVLDNTGSTFEVTPAMGAWSVSGKIMGGTFRTTGDPVSFSAQFSGTNEGLDGVTLDGAFSGTTVVRNGLTMASGATFDVSQFRLYDTQTITGGAFRLMPSSDSIVTLAVQSTIYQTVATATLSPTTVVEGYGRIQATDDDTVLINEGTIRADQPGHTLTIQAETSGTGTHFVNDGLLEATNGGSINVEYGRWSNTGTIRADTGSAITLNGNYALSGQLDPNGGTIALRGVIDSAGVGTPAQLDEGVTIGATIKNTSLEIATGVVTPITSNSTFENVAVVGDMSLSASRIFLDGAGGFDLDGTLTVEGSGKLVQARDTQTFSSGTMEFQDNGGTAHQLRTSSGVTLTIDPNATVSGGNLIIGTPQTSVAGDQGNEIINQGTIEASAGSRVDLIADNLVNDGMIRVQSGATLNIAAPISSEIGTIVPRTWSGTGSIEVNGGSLLLGGSFLSEAVNTVTNNGGTITLAGRMDNTGATFTIDGAANSFEALDGRHQFGGLTGSQIVGGTISYLNGGQVNIGASNGLGLDAVTVNGDWTIEGELIALNGTQFNDTLTLSGPDALLTVASTAKSPNTLSSGTFAFDGTGASLPFVPTIASDDLVIGSGVTIRGGTGWITREGSGTSDLANAGTISADVSGETLYVRTNFVNTGTMEAINGATLQVGDSPNGGGNAWSNTGVLRAISSTLELNGSFATQDIATLDLSNATVRIGGGVNNSTANLVMDGALADWSLGGAVIKGGQITMTNGAVLDVEAPSTLWGVQLNGNATIGAGASLSVRENLALNGSISLAGDAAELVFTGDQTFASGEIVFDPSSGGAQRVVRGYGSNYITLGPGATLRGGNGLLETGSDVNRPPTTIINEGLISADANGEDLTIDVTRFLNLGTIEAINGGNIVFYDPVTRDVGILTNEADILVGQDSRFRVASLVQGQDATTTIEISASDDTWIAGRLLAGSLSLDGTLKLQIGEEFTPTKAHALKVMSFASVSGAFSEILLPDLPAGWSWDVSGLYTSGTIRAVPGPASGAVFGLGLALCVRRRRRS